MFARAIRISAVAAAAGLCLSAQAANPAGIGQSGSLVWEQVRFYGPSSGADSTYTGGQPTYLGSVASDGCSGADTCGEPMSFSTLIGGALTVTATDDANGMQNSTNGIVYQDLSPSYGGLGVMSRNESTGAMTGGDEINKGDTLTLSFANTVKIVGFLAVGQRRRRANAVAVQLPVVRRELHAGGQQLHLRLHQRGLLRRRDQGRRSAGRAGAADLCTDAGRPGCGGVHGAPPPRRGGVGVN
jgi:hypothetical protein